MKLAIFDIDGTLSNTNEVDNKCYFKAFQTVFGVDLSHTDWSEIKNFTDWGITEELVFNTHQKIPTNSEYTQIKRELVANMKSEWETNADQFKEVTGSVAFFNHIHTATDWQVGIATGAWEKSAIIKLNAVGINPTNIPFSNSDYHKTREGITRHAIDQLTARNPQAIEEIVYFGDGEWDYKTCKNLGIRFIGIDFLNTQKLQNLGAKTVFRDYQNPNAILRELNK